MKPEEIIQNFSNMKLDWETLQCNDNKSLRESWVAAQFLSIYNNYFKTGFQLPQPSFGDNNKVPDIAAYQDSSTNRLFNLEITEVSMDWKYKKEKYSKAEENLPISEISGYANPSFIELVRTILCSRIEDKLQKRYGNNVSLLIYFNIPMERGGETFFFDILKIIESYYKSKEIIDLLEENKKNNLFREIWLYTDNSTCPIVSLYPDFKAIKIG
jgi:hypothetical protein